MRAVRVMTAILILAGAGRGAEAAPLIFTDPGAFNAAIAGATLTRETFDGTLGQGTISSNVGPSNNVATVGALRLRSPRIIVATNDFGSTDSAVGSNFTLGIAGRFAFEGLTANAFGILVAAESGRTPTLTVLVDGTAVGTVAVSATESFIGVVDRANTFSTVAFGAANVSTGFTTFDDARFGLLPRAVPEPANLALLAFGLLGLGLARRRAPGSAT